MDHDNLLPVKGHPDLRKDLNTGAVISVSSNSAHKERKKRLRERHENMESRIRALEALVMEMRSSK